MKATRGKSPALFIPDGFSHMVGWFWELRSFCNDKDHPVTPGIVMDWAQCLGVLPSSWEKATLFGMDRVFRNTLSEEIAYNEERQRASEARKAKK